MKVEWGGSPRRGLVLKVNPDYAQARDFPKDRASALVYRSAAYNLPLVAALSSLDGFGQLSTFFPLFVHQP
jgi:hypothetical protein